MAYSDFTFDAVLTQFKLNESIAQITNLPLEQLEQIP